VPVKGQWVRQLEEMKACGRADEIAARFGPPAHKVREGDVEIWHYPLGLSGGMTYSIHVAVAGGDDAARPQAYMHMEASATVDESAGKPKRPWWKLW
jgi:hypothetical protein